MAIKLKAMGWSVVIVVMLSETLQSQILVCKNTEQTNYGCPFQKISFETRWCVADIYNEPGFVFYIKPGNDFNGLKVEITKTDRLIGLGLTGTGHHTFLVNKALLPKADKWYRIQLWSGRSGWFGYKIAYYLSIDGHEMFTKEWKLTKGSKFTVMVSGSPFYSTNNCNPGDFPPPSITNPPGSMNSHLMVNSENLSQEPSTNFTVFVIIGAVFMIIIIGIITAVVMVKKRRVNTEAETGGDNEERVTSTTTVTNNCCQSQATAAPLDFHEYDDTVNHIYEKPIDYNDEEHIYETMEGLGGSVTFGDVKGGQSQAAAAAAPPNFYEYDNLANNIYEDPEDYNDEQHVYETVENLGGSVTFVDGNGGQSMAYHVASPGRYNIPNQPDNGQQTRR